MATTVTTSSYTPESRTYTYTEQYTLPTGSAPQPLPTSRTYVRPVKQHKGIGAGIKDAFHRASGKAQRSMFFLLFSFSFLLSFFFHILIIITAWNEATDERFRRYFSFPYDEQLFGEWWGDVWSGGELIPCSVYVSNNYLCILYKRKNPTTKDKVHIRATIALRDITFLQRACCLPAATGHTPVIQPINDPSIKADSIIVYTNDGKVFTSLLPSFVTRSKN